MPFYEQPQPFQRVLSSFMQQDGLPFADVLTEEKIQQAFDDEGVCFAQGEDDVYTPAVTLWAFLSQVLFRQGEQRSLLGRRVTRCRAGGSPWGRNPAPDNTAACSPRPAPSCRSLSSAAWRWLCRMGCEQKTADELVVERPTRPPPSTKAPPVSIPGHTVENQRDYPQPSTQAKGVGFSTARMVVLLSLATGHGSGHGPGALCVGKETGETALLRQLFDWLQAGDVVLGDRYYRSYFLIALLMERGADVVTRLHQAPRGRLRRGQRLGHGAYHLVDVDAAR